MSPLLIVQQLSNRELSVLIWGIFLFVLAVIFSSSIRKSFWDVLKTLFSGKILVMLIMNVAFFALVITGIKHLQIWNDYLWKDATFWFFTSFTLLFSANKALEDKNHYKKEFLKLIRWEVVLIFFISLHSFSLAKELIFLPAFSLLILLQTVSSLKAELKKAESFFMLITALTVLFLIGYSIWESFIQPSSTFSISNLYSLIFPIALTVIYIPFLYIFSLYMMYESLFCRFRILIKDRFTFIHRLHIILSCGVRIDAVKEFQKLALQKVYVRSEEDLLKTLKNYRNAN